LIECVLIFRSLRLRLLETRFWNLLKLLRKSSSRPSAFISEQGTPLPFYHVI